MKRAALAGLFALTLLSMGGMEVESLSAQGTLEEVTAVRFRGNHEFPDQVLADAIMTRETECRSTVLSLFCLLGADFSQDRHYFHDREFQRDQVRIRLFYYQRGYRETTVDTVVSRPSEGKVEVTFEIQEGPPVRVREVDFTGVEEIQDSTLFLDLPIREGDPLNALVMEASRDSLTSRLQDLGYAHAEVLLNYSLPRETPLEAGITFDLYLGPEARLGPITVLGNTRISESVVRRMLPFREGRVFDQRSLLDGQRNLYNLDIFNRATVVPDLNYQPDSIVPIRVEVAEGDVHRVRGGAGFSGAECVNTEARWVSRNFFGGARRLQITARGSNLLTPFLEKSLCRDAGKEEYGAFNWLISADFTQPWLFSPRNALSVSVFGERQSYPETFIRQALGVSAGVSHTFTAGTAATVSYRPQLSSLDAAEIFLCSNYLVCTTDDIRILQDQNWLAPLGVRLSQDRRNQVLSPTRGYSAILDVEYASTWTGSNFGYVRVLSEGSWYRQGRSRLVLATRLRGGWVSSGAFDGALSPGTSGEIIHPEKRLYAGGANSVRGFGQNRLGPKVLYLNDVERLLEPGPGGGGPCTREEINDATCDAGFLPDDSFDPRPTGGTVLLEGSVEFRFPLAGQTWEGATFLDFGQVWEEDLGVDLRDLEFTPGGGIRYYSPIGPIRVDVGYRFNSSERLQVVTRRFVQKDGSTEWEPGEELVLLEPRVLWGEDYGIWSLRRFQLHLSIGQAF